MVTFVSVSRKQTQLVLTQNVLLDTDTHTQTHRHTHTHIYIYIFTHTHFCRYTNPITNHTSCLMLIPSETWIQIVALPLPL